MIRKHVLSGMVIFSALLTAQFSFADSNYYTWDDQKGFQAAQKCDVMEVSFVPFFVVDSTSQPARTLRLAKGSSALPDESIVRVLGKRTANTSVEVVGVPGGDSKLNDIKGTINATALKDLSGRVLQVGANPPVATFGSSNIPVAQSLWEVEMKDGSFLVSHCEIGGHAVGYTLFNVFTPDSKTPVLEVGLLSSDSKILENSTGYTTEEAEKLPATVTAPAKSATIAAGVSVRATSKTSTPLPAGVTSHNVPVICTPHGLPAPVYDATLKKVIGHIADDTAIQVNSSSSRSGYESISLYVGKLSGYVAKSMVMPAFDCGRRTPKGLPTAGSPTPTPPPPPPAPAPAPSPTPTKPPTSSPGGSTSNPSPSESKIICTDAPSGKVYLRDSDLNILTSEPNGVANGTSVTELSSTPKPSGKIKYVEVDLGNVQGWIDEEFLVDNKSECPSLNVRYVCTTDGSDLNFYADKTMKKTDDISNLADVELMGQTKTYNNIEYVRVKFGSDIGWVDGDYLIADVNSCASKGTSSTPPSGSGSTVSEPSGPDVSCLEGEMQNVPSFAMCYHTGNCTGHKNPRVSLGDCALFTKAGIMHCHASPTYISCEYAKDCGPGLLQAGFQKLGIKDPRQAPNGAVIVYNSLCEAAGGHIEVKESETEWNSDFIETTPRSEQTRCRPVLGIYYKP